MTQLALRTTIILLIAIAALALWQMREAVQLLAVAVAVAAGLAPLVDRLSQRGMARPRAAAIIFGGGIVATALTMAAYGSLVAVELAALSEEMPLRYLRLRETLAASGGWMAPLNELLPSSTAITGALLGGDAAIAPTLLSAAASTAGLVILLISVASLGFYWIVEEQRFTRLWLSLLPLETRTRARAVWGEIAREIGIYVRGVAAIVTLTTFSLLSIFTLLGVPGAAALALVGGLAQVIPLLGPPLAVIPGLLMALGQGQVTAALALIGTVFVVAVVRLVIGPRLFREGITVNPVLVVVVIMALAEIGGLGMVLLGPPLAAALQASTRTLLQQHRSQAAQPRAARLDEIEERLDDIAARVDPREPDAPRLSGMIARARRLIADTRAN